MRIALVAGEASGDLLGAGLIHALREKIPDAKFVGVAGPQMARAGCDVWYPSERLAVMGLTEVLRHLPSLLRLRRELKARLLADPPDVFIGIDAPDFNLTLETALKERGIPTVHYVSPSVWAWRSYRLHKIGRAIDLMLTLFPFEADYYRAHGIPVHFVGHPLADVIPAHVDQVAARRELGLAFENPVVALMPGSRHSEVSRLLVPFLQTAQWCRSRVPNLQLVLPAASDTLREYAEAQIAQFPGLAVKVLAGKSHAAMAAADAVLVASGTATLECLLFNRPMVVGYRLSPLSYQIVKRLLRVPYFSLPNLLAGEPLVAEFAQAQVVAEQMGPALLLCLTGDATQELRRAKFAALGQSLRKNASAEAAAAVLALLRSR